MQQELNFSDLIPVIVVGVFLWSLIDFAHYFIKRHYRPVKRKKRYSDRNGASFGRVALFLIAINLMAAELPPLPPGAPAVKPATTKTRAAATFSGVKMAVVAFPKTTNLYSLVFMGYRSWGASNQPPGAAYGVYPRFGLVFKTNVAFCWVSNSVDMQVWSCWTQITNAVAGKVREFGYCPPGPYPKQMFFRVAIP